MRDWLIVCAEGRQQAPAAESSLELYDDLTHPRDMPLLRARRPTRRTSYAESDAGRQARLSARLVAALCQAQGRERATLDDIELADRMAAALLAAQRSRPVSR